MGLGLLFDTAYGLGDAGAPGVDPATDPNITAVWDHVGAVADVNGVNSLPSAVAGALDLEQTVDSLKPVDAAQGLETDAVDDILEGVAGVKLGDLIDADGFVLLFALKTPAVFVTDAGNLSTNEGIFHNTFGYLSIYFANTPNRIGFMFRDNAEAIDR